jgi:hypothetical protein
MTADTKMMTFWRGNRIDAEFTRAIPEVAAEFWASSYGRALAAGYRYLLERELVTFLTAADGLHSVWTDEAAYNELRDEVARTWPDPS